MTSFSPVIVSLPRAHTFLGATELHPKTVKHELFVRFHIRLLSRHVQRYVSKSVFCVPSALPTTARGTLRRALIGKGWNWRDERTVPTGTSDGAAPPDGTLQSRSALAATTSLANIREGVSQFVDEDIVFVGWSNSRISAYSARSGHLLNPSCCWRKPEPGMEEAGSAAGGGGGRRGQSAMAGVPDGVAMLANTGGIHDKLDRMVVTPRQTQVITVSKTIHLGFQIWNVTRGGMTLELLNTVAVDGLIADVLCFDIDVARPQYLCVLSNTKSSSKVWVFN